MVVDPVCILFPAWRKRRSAAFSRKYIAVFLAQEAHLTEAVDEVHWEGFVSRLDWFTIKVEPPMDRSTQSSKSQNCPFFPSQCTKLPPKAVSAHLLQLQPSLDLTQLSFQLNLVLSSEIGDLSSFVMNGEWAILGKAWKRPAFSFCRLFQLFLDLCGFDPLSQPRVWYTY